MNRPRPLDARCSATPTSTASPRVATASRGRSSAGASPTASRWRHPTSTCRASGTSVRPRCCASSTPSTGNAPRRAGASWARASAAGSRHAGRSCARTGCAGCCCYAQASICRSAGRSSWDRRPWPRGARKAFAPCRTGRARSSRFTTTSTGSRYGRSLGLRFPGMSRRIIVHGRRDDVVPIASSRRYATLHPHVELVEVDDDHSLSSSVAVLETILRREWQLGARR